MNQRVTAFMCSIIFLAFTAIGVFGEDTIEAFAADGKGVLLHDDGTWEYSGWIGFFDVERTAVESVDEIKVAELLVGTIIEVIDGDTVKVSFEHPPPGVRNEETVRLLGVDTPEIHSASRAEPLAIEAREYVAASTANPLVYLAFESKWRGLFGRLLAYVFTFDGSLLNADLIARGFASVYNDIPCHFHQYFVSLEVEARLERKGMWTDPVVGDVIIRQVYNDGRTEYVELWNRTDQSINLSGWYLRDTQGNRIEIPRDSSIRPGASFFVLSGSGTPRPPSDHAYPTHGTIWNNDGDTARLFDEDEELVSEHSY